MSKILKVSQGDYRIQVQTGGNITLDAGTNPDTTGNIIVYGNLDVKGKTTTVESSNINISDNILYLNVGQTGNGISSTLGYVSGIAIKRGNYPDAQFYFNDSVTHYNPTTGTYVSGTWVMKDSAGSYGALQVGSLANSGATDFVFDMQGSNHALLVANSPNYEQYVSQDNHLINRKYLTNYVAANNGVATVDRIYFPTSGAINTANTSIQSFGSSINFSVAQTLVASVTAGGVTVGNINQYQNTIGNTSLGNNLILTAINSNVEVNAILNLDDQTPTVITNQGGVVSGKSKVYSSATVGPGNTGLYLVRSSVQDELVSKNRAVLLGILL
jgi:hypothetical protein